MALVMPRLYAIIDRAHVADRSLASVAGILVQAGITLIQYRDKQATSRDLYDRCRELTGVIRHRSATLIVNDRADVALATDADGVHLGQDDLPVELARRVLKPGRFIGCSAHNLEQVIAAKESSADYIAFGPVFATTSKEAAGPVVGLDGLRQARTATRKPLVAIGGITVERARAAIDAGADGVAVIGGLLDAEDLEAQAREFLAALAV